MPPNMKTAERMEETANPAPRTGILMAPALAPGTSVNPAPTATDLGQFNQFAPDGSRLNLFADKAPPASHQQNPTFAVQPLPHQLSQIMPDQAESNQFADKARLIQALSHHARFILRRRRAGKIAHLPATVREQINLMLLNGLPCAAIIANLGQAGSGLNKDNLSRWRKAQHQDWLADRAWQEALALRPSAPQLVKDLARLLHETDAAGFHALMAQHPDAFNRICNLSARVQAAPANCSLPQTTSQSSPQTLA
jgi:hypothetical protein